MPTQVPYGLLHKTHIFNQLLLSNVLQVSHHAYIYFSSQECRQHTKLLDEFCAELRGYLSSVVNKTDDEGFR